jgi:RES domain
VTKASNPTPSFNRAALHLATVDPGARFGRIILNRHSDALGFGKTPSRFSDPRRRIPSHRFGVIYLGETLKVCFLEAVLRDSRNGAVGDYPMDERELRVRRYVEIEIAAAAFSRRSSGRWRDPDGRAERCRARVSSEPGASMVSGFPSAPFRA